MKTLFFFLLFTANCFAFNYNDMKTYVEKEGLDTPIHCSVGIISYYVINVDNPVIERLLEITTSLAIGYVKELSDQHFDKKDIYEYAVPLIKFQINF